MDRDRYGSPLMARQRSNASNSSGESPVLAAARPQVRAGASGVGSRRAPNYTAKAAAARLAQAMASQANDDEEDDDPGFSFPSALSASGRAPSPLKLGNHSNENPAVTTRLTSRPSITKPSTPSVLSLQPSAKSRPPPSPVVHAPETNDVGRLGSRPPPSPVVNASETNDIGRLGSLGRFSQAFLDDRRETASLHDKIDELEEEKEDLVSQVRALEDRYKEAEARAKLLEKQVANLGEGVSLEARLISRKEAALKQREAALKAAKESKDARDDEIAALRLEVEAARDEAASATEQARNAESEANALRTMTHKMILTQEEMEEVVLKRCWLARYWGLCIRYGIHAEIAGPKHDYWSSFAPLPLEVVLEASQKAKEEPYHDEQNGNAGSALEKRSARDMHDISTEGNIGTMLSVEKGLRELASLKVEDAIILAMAQQRRPSPVRVGQAFVENTPLKGIDSARLAESFDLSPEEIEDTQFKQAWLVYFWRRAKTSGVEEDIADERLQYWISRSSQTPTFQDAVDVDRGLTELRKLGIENQLWDASRKAIQEASLKASSVAEEEAYPSHQT
ncbi:hypothetical protein KP509_02G080400 [Ceratopteris richardii]|uniref:Ripening-regulated protein n=1 Tax=Ceratopteris richardii TaxID=49495 RepID=A0A8T2V7M8_CERRI|nr:hypothetical protein KP509_02G080400 [Ceratopteris richardii]